MKEAITNLLTNPKYCGIYTVTIFRGVCYGNKKGRYTAEVSQ